MRLLFKTINLNTIEDYKQYWKLTPQKSSDYSTGVLLCWERALGYQLAFEETEDLVWIRGRVPDDHYLAPVGNWNHSDWEEIILARFGSRVQFRLVPEKLLDIWKDQFGASLTVTEARGSWEYLHHVEELAHLVGNKYVKKRNRINQFMKQNPFTYFEITPAELPRLIEFQNEWCDSYRVFGDSASIENESDGIIRSILGKWEQLPQLLGGGIEVMGRVVAYTVAEIADESTIMIHFEKASLEYNAAYQVINHEFLNHGGAGYEIVNREEDMDDPGLRDAKLSYHPFDFIKKYTVDIDLD